MVGPLTTSPKIEFPPVAPSSLSQTPIEKPVLSNVRTLSSRFDVSDEEAFWTLTVVETPRFLRHVVEPHGGSLWREVQEE